MLTVTSSAPLWSLLSIDSFLVLPPFVPLRRQLDFGSLCHPASFWRPVRLAFSFLSPSFVGVFDFYLHSHDFPFLLTLCTNAFGVGTSISVPFHSAYVIPRCTTLTAPSPHRSPS
ncbi:hypothetical protein TNCV_3736401 [Trichonephila clavipes]|nr:hypothetical protein TNCV_3736401 [Trichonephila clavipes]